MAIVKIGVMVDPPGEEDWTILMGHVSAFARQVSGNQFILTQTAGTGLPALALGAYIQHGGVVYQVQTADEVISGTPADGTYYIKVAASSDVLVATWITDISGYTWNAVYNCLTAVDESQLLPYMVVVSGSATVYTKYALQRFAQRMYGDLSVAGALGVTGAITGASYSGGTVGATKVTETAARTAGDFNLFNLTTERTGSMGSYEELTKRIKVSKGGTYRIAFTAKANGTGSPTGVARIYKNGSAFGTERSITGSYQTFSEDLALVAGDYISVWANSAFGATVKDFKLSCNEEGVTL